MTILIENNLLHDNFTAKHLGTKLKKITLPRTPRSNFSKKFFFLKLQLIKIVEIIYYFKLLFERYNLNNEENSFEVPSKISFSLILIIVFMP
jgi:hypothetical protein